MSQRSETGADHHLAVLSVSQNGDQRFSGEPHVVEQFLKLCAEALGGVAGSLRALGTHDQLNTN